MIYPIICQKSIFKEKMQEQIISFLLTDVNQIFLTPSGQNQMSYPRNDPKEQYVLHTLYVHTYPIF